jgi:penicillin G amidase
MIGALGAAGATLGAASAWYRLFRRPLPKTSGSIRVGGLEGEVEIARDRLGVPRIKAGSVADLCFAHGFCHGQDRLFQLEFYRRVASGRVAEFAGEEGLEIDKPMRALGLRRVAERETETIPAYERELLIAYAEGLNAAMSAARALPLELQLLRIEPEPWTPTDSLAIGKVLALGFSTNMEAELFRADLVKRIGAEKTAHLEPRYPQGNPVVTTPGVEWSGDALALIEQIERVREAIGLSPQPAGSNNWVVSGERSETGKPLLSGDPHITATIPDVWYTIGLSSPELELWGASMPGFPGCMIGHTPHVAWSFTNVLADVQDLFVERVREAPEGDGDAPQYEFEGSWLPLTVHREEIGVRGRSEPELFEVRETHHGPIVNEALDAGEGEPLALSWTALREPFFSRMSLDAGRCRTGAELIDGMADFAVPCMNALWADSSGNIGYKLVGRLPRRRGGCPDLPKPGWTGEFEWEGYVPYAEQPELLNPPDGALVTANNRIAPDDFPHHITSDYFDGYRAARIEQLLGEREKHTLDSFERILSDFHSIPGVQVAERLQQLDPPGERERRALQMLAEWDGNLDADTVAGTIYQLFFTVHFSRDVALAIVGHEADADRWRARSGLGFTEMRASEWRWQARLIELWDEADEELTGRPWNEIALESLKGALDELEERWGDDPSGWTWGRVHGIHFAHPLGEGEGKIGSALDRLLSRRRTMGGAAETVAQTAYVPYHGDYTGMVGPSFRLLADLGDPSRSRWQHMTGQSGHPGSPHYDDLIDDWVAGRSNPADEPAVDTLSLEPA